MSAPTPVVLCGQRDVRGAAEALSELFVQRKVQNQARAAGKTAESAGGS